MYLIYTLSMPGVASWNGRWSGEGKFYAVVRQYGTRRSQEFARKILNDAPYHYRWNDGWAAQVSVREATSLEARRAKKASQGFCGYDWMIDSIETYGAIYANHEKPASVPVND